jgi:hypothetical protein
MVGMMTETKFKRGYENGEQTLEIYEGKVDLVLYNDKPNSPSFYFYRFPSQVVFGEKLSREVSLVHRHEVEKFLKKKGMDYGELIEKLLHVAWSNDMTMRDEM